MKKYKFSHNAGTAAKTFSSMKNFEYRIDFFIFACYNGKGSIKPIMEKCPLAFTYVFFGRKTKW